MVNVLSSNFEKCFDTFTMLLVEGCSERGLFRHLSKQVFWSPSVQKYISYEGPFFLRKCSKLDLNLENEKKIEKKFLVSKIIASENVAINCLF